MTGTRTKILVEAALCIALAAVLNFVKLWHMPMGGDVSLEMLPIVVFALRRGVGPGMVTGALYGIVQLMFGASVFNWAQFLLDYPLAYAMVGAAGALAPLARPGQGVWRSRTAAVGGVLLAGALRMAMHWLSGVVFFAAYAPAGQPAWLYSVVYNATYMVPATLLCAVAALALLPALEKAAPS
jgi:thiamine transporter